MIDRTTPGQIRPDPGLVGVQLIVLLGALSAFGPLSIDMYLPGLPDLRRDFDTGASSTQLTLSACLLGLALGQMLAGPLSDALGRRRPLLIGLAAYATASFLCAFAPSVGALVGLRFVQGAAGAAGIVIARAIVRDLYSGVAAARFFSQLMLVNGTAPILAPLLGGQLLRFTPWRGIFVVLAAIGAILCAAAALGLKDTLHPVNRRTGGTRGTLATFRRLLTERAFVGYLLSSGFAFAAMFSYISGSPFVLQEIYGLSPQGFSLLFGINALGIVAIGQINGRLVAHRSLVSLLGAGLTISVVGGLSLLAIVAVGGIGLVGVLPALFLVVASIGLIAPNATALALADHPRTAGSASALLGLTQYAVGATVAPLVGVAGTDSALPMALVIATCGLVAMIAFALLIARPTGRT